MDYGPLDPRVRSLNADDVAAIIEEGKKPGGKGGVSA